MGYGPWGCKEKDTTEAICTKCIYRVFNSTNVFKVKKSCSQILDFRSRILFLCMLFYLFLAALGLGCCIGFFL